MFSEKIFSLVSQLYPKGRAFKMVADGYKEAVHKAIATKKAELLDNAINILDSAIPDNDNFSASDASAWERRLGLITNTAVSLSDRKLAIRRKMNYPGEKLARQHFTFLQKQLQLAGFAVFVHENRFTVDLGASYFTVDPISLGGSGTANQHGNGQHSDGNQHGATYNKIIANSIDPAVDSLFSVGSTLRFTFFICGDSPGTIANIPASREAEFRQLVLKLKPLHTVAYLFINYTT